MPIASVAGFLQLLDRYGLVEPEQRPHLALLAPAGPGDPRAFAREVLRRGWLTPYQLDQIFGDNGAALQVGSYVILERLGSGGMGNVFKARHQKLGRVVALKIIHEDKLDNPAAVKRFRREIQVAASLDHPNIVHAYDAEEVNGAQVLVMEYLEGTDLGKRVKDGGPVPVREACEYVRQAALALQHAHEKGLVHRDVKPANLMLQAAPQAGGAGTIKLLDLGLALLQRPLIDGAAAGALTVAGKVVGTVDFLAPEQAQDASRVDIRADLYALGCTFYYLLAGLAPFAGGTVTNKLFKHALEEPEPVQRLCPDVPPPVAAVVRRLMAKRPEDRFQTPAELAAVLDGVLVGRPLAAVPDWMFESQPAPPYPVPPAAERVEESPPVVASSRAPRKKSAGRRRWLILNAAGLAVLLVMIGVLALVLHTALGSPDGTARDEARLSAAERAAQAELDVLRRRHEDGLEDKERIRQDVVAFWSRHPALPQALLAASLLRELPSPLDALDPAMMPPEQRFDGQPPELVAVVPTPATAALVAPEASRVLTANGATAALSDLLTGSIMRRFDKVRGEVQVLALAADGRRALLGGRGGNLGVWDVHTGREVRKLDGYTGDVTAAALSPDGRWALAGGDDKTVHLWNLEDGTTYPLEGHAEAVTAVGFTPDGKQALSASADRTVRVWDVDVRREPKPAASAPEPVTCLAVAPDGKHLYTGSAKGVRLWSLGPLTAERPLSGNDGPVSSLALTADGRYLAAARPEIGSVRVWDLGSRPKPKEWKLPAALGVSWALDGRQLVVAGGARGVYVLRLP